MQASRPGNSPRIDSALERAAADYRKALPADWSGACCAALLDESCNIVAATDSARMVGIASAAAAMRTFFDGDWRDGDVALTNDPYHGSAHLLQFTAISPVGTASGGAIRGFAALHGDLSDIGGWEIGGDDPRSLDIWAEGARIVPVKCALGGQMRRELLELLALNSRTPRLVQRAVTALSGGAIALAREAAGADPDLGSAAIRVRESAASAIQALLERFPRGECRGAATARVPGFADLAVRIELALTVRDGVLHVEVLQAPPKSVHPINATPAMTQAAVLQALEAALRLEPWMMPGLERKVRIAVPHDSALAVTDWLPVGYARRVTSRAVFAAVLDALSAAGFSGVDAEEWWHAHSGLEDADLDPRTGKASASRRAFLLSMEAAACGRA